MPKNPVMIEKHKVMELLKRSERAVENMVSAGKLHPKYYTENGVKKPMFFQEEVLAYKAARDNPQLLPVAGLPRQGMLAIAAPAAAPEEEEEEAEDRQFDHLPAAVRLTLRESARYLRVPVPWLRRCVKDGTLPYDNVWEGREAIRIRRADLDNLEAKSRKKRMRSGSVT